MKKKITITISEEDFNYLREQYGRRDNYRDELIEMDDSDFITEVLQYCIIESKHFNFHNIIKVRTN